jgi:hypothetical protein
MENETPTSATTLSRVFTIPVSLLTRFQNELRILPPRIHPAGYIMFDQKMLISVLRSDNAKMRMELADTLEVYHESGGELVMMGKEMEGL